MPTAASISDVVEFEHVFRSFDKDGDGRISAAELRCYMSATLGEEIPAEDAAALVASADADGDGLLDVDEFTRLAKFADGEEGERIERELREAFGMYENEGEGCITPKSLRRMLSRLGASRGVEECRNMIRRFDIDGDGVLSFEEFRIMMMV
ncbi:putative calcium-binding protein CML19 [Ananas comosus]|uniref:Calcium-binding protein CML19 n=1 Tax=Ananas comosus TaxID=4615 RepID=A0A199VBE8_ANACO|nr:putative calcium-binding protein CML19 [Ananas comosus]OAY74409.1 putative calcium-binding protein [Ananas comosus]